MSRPASGWQSPIQSRREEDTAREMGARRERGWCVPGCTSSENAPTFTRWLASGPCSQGWLRAPRRTPHDVHCSTAAILKFLLIVSHGAPNSHLAPGLVNDAASPAYDGSCASMSEKPSTPASFSFTDRIEDLSLTLLVTKCVLSPRVQAVL